MGALSDAIDGYNEEKKRKMAPEVLATMAQATEELVNSGIENRALRSGDSIPDFELPDQNGNLRRFYDYLAESRVVLNIYRGGWCPYCNMEMKALHDVLAEIEAQGARLIGMAPETPDKAMATAERHQMPIDILSDQGNRVAEQLGLVFTLPETLRSIYQKNGLDIPAYNGDETFKLPLPATYILDTDGKVLFDFVDADYTRRLEPAEIVARLAGL